MPSKPSKVNSITSENTAALLNAMAAENETLSGMPTAYAAGQTMANSRTATPEDSLMSLRAIGKWLDEFEPAANAFASELINRIGRVIITSRLYENPWRFFKKGLLELGETVEEIYVQLASPYQYNPEKDYDTVFKRYIPDIEAAFHGLNFQKYYPTTINRAQLRQAFLSWEGIADLVSRTLEQIYTGANYDEFIVMKYQIARLALDGFIRPVNVPEVTAENARQVTTTMVAQARNLGFMSNKNNFAGVRTYTDPSKMYMILTTDISSIFDVEVLALSFNMDKAELIGRQVYVDGFGEVDSERLSQLFADDPFTSYVPFTSDELTQLSTIQGLMCDENFFMIFDSLLEMTEVYNPKTLEWTYFYHVWKIFSASPFANAVLFTTAEPSVTGITVTPDTATVTPGQTLRFRADVATSNFADKSVLWEVSGTEEYTTISRSGKLTVGAQETATEVTVKATSMYDPNVSGTATVTIQQAGA